MKAAFSRPTDGSPVEQETLFTKFKNFGYQGLQLKGPQYQGAIINPTQFIEQWQGDTAAIASGLIAGNSLDEKGIAEVRSLFKFARAVGTERIIFCIGKSRQGLSFDDIRKYAHILSELGEEAQQMGIALSLHHHYDQPVMHREDFEVFFEAVKNQTVKLTIDTAHLAKSGITDIPAIFRDFREVLDNVHLKDFAEGKFRVLGQGELDFKAIFSVLEEIGYKNWLCVDEESGGDLSETMANSIQFIESYTLKV